MWKGSVRADAAERYVGYLAEHVIPQLTRLAGYRGVEVLRRAREGAVDFVVITRWDSMQSIEPFTGPDTSVAVVADAAQAMMIEFDRHATHYEVVLGR